MEHIQYMFKVIDTYRLTIIKDSKDNLNKKETYIAKFYLNVHLFFN